MNLIIVFLVGICIFVIGGVLGWLIWYKLKPKTRTWTARCYQLGDGSVKRGVIKDKQTVGYLRLKDLKPYTIDTLKRTEYESGTNYRLLKQNLTTQAVTADMVDYWGKDKMEVNVLIEGDTATLMKKGYDAELGELLFRPMPRERIEMIKSELRTHNIRMEETKGLLASVLPWIGVIIVGMSLFAAAYFFGDAAVKIADKATSIECKGGGNAEPDTQQTTRETDLGTKPTEQKPPDIS